MNLMLATQYALSQTQLDLFVLTIDCLRLMDMLVSMEWVCLFLLLDPESFQQVVVSQGNTLNLLVSCYKILETLLLTAL